MPVTEILSQFESLGGESYRKILMNHGASEPVFGVKIGDLKKLKKQINTDYQLALELYDSGIYDAQYLAGLITDDAKMTKKNLRHWLAKANCPAISSSIVAWVTAESRYGSELAISWIDAKKETTSQTGWMTLCSFVAITADAHLDLKSLASLLKRVEKTIHEEPNDVRYAMNAFVISLGTYVSELSDLAMQVAHSIGTVSVDKGKTACKVPNAIDSIRKAQQKGVIGRKRKTAKC